MSRCGGISTAEMAEDLKFLKLGLGYCFGFGASDLDIYCD
jgi:hypothetical protein